MANLRWAEGIKKEYWDKNQAKICSYVLMPIIIPMTICTIFWPIGFNISAILSTIFITLLLWFVWMRICLDLDYCGDDEPYKLTDKLIFRQMPKFLLKVIILTIRKVHSQKLFAVSLYSLSGMLYILVFPPFNLVPTMVFLMAIGCGIFTGLGGLAMHKVLSTTVAQTIFIKVEAW